MTYNFDPDQWYENELAIIHSKYIAGKLTKDEIMKKRQNNLTENMKICGND